MPDLMSMTEMLDTVVTVAQQVTTVALSDDDVYIPANLKNWLVSIGGGVGIIVSTLFWQLLSSWKDRAQRSEKQYDDMLPIVQDSTSAVEKLNTSVTALMETYREELRSNAASRRAR